ncbi:hypothetical protein PRIPAC_71495 [Pristionchus pacificus]|nr:hypothetical protein PRIPAC_71495 [Pristionchus pacificus]
MHNVSFSSLTLFFVVLPSSVLCFYYKGANRNTPRCEGTCVNERSIYKSLFSTSNFYSIFDSEQEIPNIEVRYIERPYSPGYIIDLSQTPAPKIPITVKNINAPFFVDESIPLFWGEEYSLPWFYGCKELVFSNSERSLIFCNVTNSRRCTKGIDSLPEFNRFSLQSHDGNQLSFFSWFCPQGQLCCGFGCCVAMDENASSGIPLWKHIVYRFYGYSLLILLMGCFLACLHRHGIPSHRRLIM